MNEEQLKILNDGGINTEEALKRLMGNEALFTKVLNKFLNDNNFTDYLSLLESGDIENAERSLHGLKGVAGNLGITKLYELSAEIDTGLKEGKIPDEDKNKMLKKAYESAVEAIKKIEMQ